MAESLELGSSDNNERQKTATRATLSREWRDLQTKIDWMHAPHMASYVNSLVSGKDLNAGGHWALYARDQHVIPLAEAHPSKFPNRGLSMLSLGCGNGHIEESLISQFEWPISHLVGLEYDALLREDAAARFETIDGCNAEFYFFDFNNCPEVSKQYDIIFTCHAIHHATELESFLKFINANLKENGLFIGIEFLGPARFQIEYDVFPIIDELFSILPSHLRRDLRTPEMPVTKEFKRVTIDEIIAADPSESVRSSDLRTLLLANFKIHDVKPMGGTLLRWLLQYRAGNFNHENPDHVAIARLLQVIEREMILSRKIQSDDLFFCLGKSHSL